MENDLLYMARGLGFDGEGIESVYALCEKHNVSEEMKNLMVKEYEEGYFDW
jgi:hypothetical protein